MKKLTRKQEQEFIKAFRKLRRKGIYCIVPCWHDIDNEAMLVAFLRGVWP